MQHPSRETTVCIELTDAVLETVTGGYYGMTSDPYGSNPEAGPWTAWGPAQGVGGDGSVGSGGAAGAAGTGMGESMGDSCGSGNCA